MPEASLENRVTLLEVLLARMIELLTPCLEEKAAIELIEKQNLPKEKMN